MMKMCLFWNTMVEKHHLGRASKVLFSTNVALAAFYLLLHKQT